MSYPSGSGPSDLIGAPTTPVGTPSSIVNIPIIKTFYSFFNYSINTGSFTETGSPTINTFSYYTKVVSAYLHTTQSVTGSFAVSGSFDGGSNWFWITGSGFLSGSTIRQTFTDYAPVMRVYLRIGGITGSACSGSLSFYGIAN